MSFQKVDWLQLPLRFVWHTSH